MKDVIIAYPGALDQGRPVPTVEWQGGPGAQGTINENHCWLRCMTLLARPPGLFPCLGIGSPEGPLAKHILARWGNMFPEDAPSCALLTHSCPKGSMAYPVLSPGARQK